MLLRFKGGENLKEILKNKTWVTLEIADLISNFGDVIYYLALLNYVLQIDNSNVGIAMINLSETLPIFFTFILGYLADKSRNRVNTIITTLIIRTSMYVFVGILIGFEPSLLIVALASLANFISDVLGQYENWLYYPIRKRLIPHKDREQVMAFTQSVSSSFNIGFKALGGVLIIYLTFEQLAFINAVSFLVSLALILSIKPKLHALYTEKTSDNSSDNRNRIVKLGAELKETIKLLWKMDGIPETLLLIPILNAALAIVTPLVVLMLSNDENFALISDEITIATLAVTLTIARLCGATATIFSLQKLKLVSAVKLALGCSCFIFVGIFMHNIYIVLVANFLSEFLCGSIDPKMGAFIFNNLDEDKLATSFSGITTYFQLGDILSKTVFSLLVLLLSPKYIAIIYGVLLVFVLMLSATNRKKIA